MALHVTISKITDTNGLLHNPMTTAFAAMKRNQIVTCYITTIMGNARFFSHFEKLSYAMT